MPSHPVKLINFKGQTLKTLAKLFVSICGICVLFYPQLSMAKNTIVFGEGVKLIALNGEEVEGKDLFSNLSEIKTENGLNQLVIKYTAEIKKGSDTELEDSQAFVILFKSDNQILNIEAPEINKLSQFEAFHKNMNWQVYNAKNEKIDYKVSILEHDGFQISRNYERELKEFNYSGAEAAVVSEIKLPSHNNETKRSSVLGGDDLALKMLLYWYGEADPETRKKFKSILNSM